MVLAERTALSRTGSNYDYTNNARLTNTVPTWILEEDETGGAQLQTITQIMGSYFDTLYGQISAIPRIKNNEYVSGSATGSLNEFPYNDLLLENLGLEAPEIFENASVLSQFFERDEQIQFEQKLSTVKNAIYKNIYNNLTYIYKSKGAEKSLRNFIRCLGVGDEIIDINVYAHNSDYTLDSNYESTVSTKKYVDFSGLNNYQDSEATVYQFYDSSDSNSVGLIQPLSINSQYAMTAECEFVFPDKSIAEKQGKIIPSVLTSSLFGFNTPLRISPTSTDTAWAAAVSDYGLHVRAVRDRSEYSFSPNPLDKSTDAYFAVYDRAGTQLLKSNTYHNVYDNKKWNIALSVRPSKYQFATGVAGAAATPYTLELCGINRESGQEREAFTVSTTIAAGANVLTSAKRFYLGAYRENASGTLQISSDVRGTSLRVWSDYLTSGTIGLHAKEVESYGRINPLRNSYEFQSTNPDVYIPQAQTLMLNWDFANITGSDAAGKFKVTDFSSGSSDGDYVSTYQSTFSTLNLRQHTGQGHSFTPSLPAEVKKEYVYTEKLQIPEYAAGDGMVRVLGIEPEAFTTLKRPIRFFYAVEKSMYRSISNRMLELFASIDDFNNLIGEPVNKYRLNYKAMEKIREIFFRKVGNVPDFDKYLDFYKWLDTAMDEMIVQLFPASAVFAPNVRTLIENHVLERPKVRYMNLGLRNKLPELTGSVKNTPSVCRDYPGWKYAHAPVNGAQNENCYWWKNLANRNNPSLGNAAYLANTGVISTRNAVRDAISTNLSSSQVVCVEGKLELPKIGGINQYINKYRNAKDLSFDKFERGEDCTDILDPNQKEKLNFRVTKDGVGYKGDLLTPFTAISSSVVSGYRSYLVAKGLSSVDLTNMHEDSIIKYQHSIPMQGPFTREHVGGFQSRHVAPLTTQGNLRKESHTITITSGTGSLDAINPGFPNGRYLRGLGAKSLVNIENIRTTTGSSEIGAGVNILGNFQHNYEVVQTNNRAATNMDFVFNNQNYYSGSIPSAFITPPAMRNIGRSGSVQYTSPREISNRRTNQTIFTERFAAPGTKQDSKQQFRDVPSDQFSPNSVLPFRNQLVRSNRTGFGSFLATHTRWGGFFRDVKSFLKPGSAAAPIGRPNYLNNLNAGADPYLSVFGVGSYSSKTISGSGLAQIAPKVQRNTTRRIQIDTSAGYSPWNAPPITGTVRDNNYVSRPIPQADRTQWFLNAAAGGWTGGSVVESIAAGDSYPIPVSNDYVQYILSGSKYPASINPTTSSLGSLYFGTSVFTGSSGLVNFPWSTPKSYASWNQLRVHNSHVGRYYRESLYYEIDAAGNPLHDILDDQPAGRWAFPDGLYTRTVTDRVGMQVTSKFSKRFKEPPITSRYKRLIHQIRTPQGTPAKTSENMKTVELKYSYGNELQGFANRELNELIPVPSLGRKYLLGLEKRPYEILRDNYNSDVPRTINGVELISRMIYPETIYPREIYTYLSGSRSRLAYQSDFWRADHRDVAVAATINTFTDVDNLNNTYNIRRANRNIRRVYSPFITSQNYEVQAIDQTPYNSAKSTPSGKGSGSMWPLDSYLYSEGYQSLNLLSAKQLFADASSMASGELMMTWHGTVDDKVGSAGNATYANNSNLVSSQYVYTVPHHTASSATVLADARSPGGPYTRPMWNAYRNRIIVDGDNKGSVATPSNRGPWYDSYEEYAEEVRTKGQNYTIIPEFRISEHISDYTRFGSLEALITSSLSITGSNHDSYDASFPQFFDRFATTDFIEYLSPFMDPNSKDLEFNKTPKHFGLKSDVIMKLLPYNGFYPVNRTLQLASQFYGAYAPGASYMSGSRIEKNDVYWRILLRPFYAPGILYNSIKSGLAVDYPIRRANRNHSQFDGVGVLNNTLEGCLSGALSVSSAGIPGNRRHFNPDNQFDFSDANVDKFFWGDRLPFESIFDPASYFKYSEVDGAPGWTLSSDINRVLHTKTQAISGSINEALLDQDKVDEYKLAVSNFMASVPGFFLKKKFSANGEKGYLTKFVSDMPGASTAQGTSLGSGASAARTVSVSKNFVYMMEIGLKKTDLFNMYSNPYAFGVPTATGSANWASYVAQNGSAQRPTGLDWPRHRGEFAPFTPPYFYGPSVVRLTYAPTESGEVTLGQILNSQNLYQEFLNENGSYYDFSSGSFRDTNGDLHSTSGAPPYGWNRAWQNRMDIDASIVIDNEFPTDSGKVKPSDPNKWVIMPKWECPILDFNPNTKAPAYNFSSSIESGHYGSLTHGMWHQYGQMPDTNQGVYMFIRDVGAKDTEFRLVGKPDGTNSTASTATITANDYLASVLDGSPGSGTGLTFIIDTTTTTQVFRFDATIGPGSPSKDAASGEYYVGCSGLSNTGDTATAIVNAITLARVNGDIDVSAVVDSTTANEVDLTADVLGTSMNTKTITGTATSSALTPTAFSGGSDGTNSGTRRLVRKAPSWIPTDKIANGIQSLASLVGFADEDIMKSSGGVTVWEPDKAKRLGELGKNEEKSLSEAIVAIPFYVGGKPGQERAIAMTLTGDPNLLGPKIKEFRRSFSKYSLPPQLADRLLDLVPPNYPNTPSYINPFAGPTDPQSDDYNEMLESDDLSEITQSRVPVVYLLEHETKLSRQDLADIWQGILPDVGGKMELQMTSIDHYMPNSRNEDERAPRFPELLKAQIDAGFPNQGHARVDLLDVPPPGIFNGMQPTIKWIVFKVKQRGPCNYLQFIMEELNGESAFEFEKIFGTVNTQGWTSDQMDALRRRKNSWAKAVYEFKHSKSFNWPYDYFSLIELGKLSTTVGFRPELDKELSIFTYDPSGTGIMAGLRGLTATPSIIQQPAVSAQSLAGSGIMSSLISR